MLAFVLLLGPPIVFACALGLLRAGTKRHWLYGILAIAGIHSLAFAGAGPSEPLLAQIGFAVLAPWLAVALLLALSSFPRHSLLNALAVPIVFALVLAGGVILGVNLGLLQV